MTTATMIQEKVHQFSPEIARLYGINAALVYHHFVQQCGFTKEDYRSESLGNLQEIFPYLSRHQVWTAMNVLANCTDATAAILERHSKANPHHYTPTCFYSGSPLHQLIPAIAEQIDVVPAIVHWSVGTQALANWECRAKHYINWLKSEVIEEHYDRLCKYCVRHAMHKAGYTETISSWVSGHDYVSQRTADRAFKKLVNSGLFLDHKVSRLSPLWKLSDTVMGNFARRFLRSMGVSEPEVLEFDGDILLTNRRGYLPREFRDDYDLHCSLSDSDHFE